MQLNKSALLVIIYAMSIICDEVFLNNAWGGNPKTFSEARALLLQGDRKAAVKLLRDSGKEGMVKSILIAEQFVTAENFQKFQDMKAYADAELWTDCSKISVNITKEDKTNIRVLKLLAQCQLMSGAVGEAETHYLSILQLSPMDSDGVMGLSVIHMHNKKYDDALKLLGTLNKRQDIDIEKLALLKSEINFFAGRIVEAVQILQQDHEKNLEHIQVLYQLGEYLQKINGEEWQARRAFALFISKYKKLKDNDLNKKNLSTQYIDAQARLATLDKKLEVTNTEGSVKSPEKSSSTL